MKGYGLLVLPILCNTYTLTVCHYNNGKSPSVVEFKLLNQLFIRAEKHHNSSHKTSSKLITVKLKTHVHTSICNNMFQHTVLDFFSLKFKMYACFCTDERACQFDFNEMKYEKYHFYCEYFSEMGQCKTVYSIQYHIKFETV